MSDDPDNSTVGGNLLNTMLQQDPYLRDAGTPTTTREDGGNATAEMTSSTAEDPTSLDQSPHNGSESQVAENEDIRAENLMQRPVKALPKSVAPVTLSHDKSGNGGRGGPAAGSVPNNPSGTQRTITSAEESRSSTQGGDQQAAAVRKSKRKAAEEADPLPDDEDSSEGRRAIPKYPKLRPPTSSQTHAQPPSTPSAPTTTARTVLEKGFNSALSLLKNFGGTTGSPGSTTTPLNSPPTKGSGSATVLITPPPTNARPPPRSRTTRMLEIEPGPSGARDSSDVAPTNTESRSIPGSLAPEASQQSLQPRSQLSEAGPTSDQAGPSVTDHGLQSPSSPHQESSESSRQSRSVSPESKASTPRPTRADKGKGRVPNSPPLGHSGGTGGVPNDPIAQLHAELRLLGTSVRGLGTAMVSLVDQNKTFMVSMGTYTEKIDQLISGGGVNTGRPRRAATKARDSDAMEVDEDANGDDADDESEPLPVKLPRRKKPFKLTSLPMRRPVEENALKAAIRQMTLDYMGRKNSKSPFDLNKLPLEEDLEAFEAAEEDDGPCCTIDDFRPDLNGTPRSKWNASVAEVFVEAYMAEGSIQCDDAALVKKFFVRHLKYLIDKFKERHTDREVLLARAKAKRRRERRTYLFNRRLIAANSEPDLQRHVYILQRFGREGMSSDESDFNNGVKQFRILKKVWRDPKLTPWLRVFDSIAREKRINPITETTRGADPRQRFESGKYDNRSPPVGQLPWNAYSEVWYKNLTAYAKKRLEARKKAYDFSHTAQIEVQANQANGSHVEGRAPRFR